MKLMLDFRYQCEIEIEEEEINSIKYFLKNDRFIPGLSKEINKVFLQEDGRTEAGGVVEFDYEIKED